MLVATIGRLLTNNAFFVVTNAIVSKEQKQSTCAEVALLTGAEAASKALVVFDSTYKFPVLHAIWPTTLANVGRHSEVDMDA